MIVSLSNRLSFVSCFWQVLISLPNLASMGKQWDKVFEDQEGRSYVLVITATTLFVFIALMSQGSRLDEGFFDSLFTVVSIGTSTGYTSTDYMLPCSNTHFLLFLLMLLELVLAQQVVA